MAEEKTEEREFPLRQIYFYLTEGCNLRCRHCWIQPKYQSGDKTYPMVELDLFRHIIKQAKPLGLSSVKLTGGEPLLHPNIREILDVVRSEKLNLNVETNGVLCTPGLAKRIKAASERPFVSVSIDGSDSETHEWVRGVEGCFDKALDGIRNLVNAGFRPQIIMSIMKRNKDQMESLIRLAESLGAGSVKFNLIQPTARGEKMHESGDTLTIQELVELGAWVDGELSATTDLRLVYSHPVAFKPLGKMFGNAGDGCGTCGIFGILGVLGNGSYALCGIGETVPEMVFGHAERDSLADVWNDTPVLNEIRKGLPAQLGGICSDCVMKGVCLGSCIAQNYYRTRNLWAPFWYCEEAKKAGLFPETRVQPAPQG